MTTAVVTQIAYAVQTLFDPAGTVGRLVDLGKLANYGLLTSFTPAYLFTAGINGTWYDPSDINLTWRRNLLTYTEQFDNAVWTKAATLVTPNSTVAPDGTLTADTLTSTGASGYIFPSSGIFANAAGATFTYSVYVKADTSSTYTLLCTSATNYTATYNLNTGVTSGVSANAQASVISAGNGWFRLILTLNNVPSQAYTEFQNGRLANGTSVHIWGAQLELGSTVTPYQRITDGIQDYLQYQPLPVLYRDAAGTVPVTAVEQPVGLMLDKSKGLVPGSELITNAADRDFSSDTGWWTKTVAGVSIGSGVCSWNASGGGINRADLCTSNKWYVVKYTITSFISGNTIRFYAKGNQTTLRSSVGTYAEYILCGSTGPEVGWYSTGLSTCSIDNVSIQELPGNHAFNPSGNSANFPVLSARYNLLTNTEDFSDAVWVKYQSATVSPNFGDAPDGTGTADLLTWGTGIASGVYQSVGSPFVCSMSLCAKAYSGSPVIGFGDDSGTRFALFNLSTGSVVSSTGMSSTAVASLGNGWYRLTAVFATAPSNIKFITGNGTVGSAYIWGADLRVANDALNQPAYQRVNTATDYDTVGFKPYVRFNGVNQWLQTNSIDFSYSDKMFVCAGVRKLIDPADAVLLELGPNANNTNGTFAIGAPVGNGVQKYGYKIKGTTAVIDVTTTNTAFTAPVTSVVSGVSSISTDVGILRVNGTQAATSTADQGTGNYGNYPLYLGARAGSSLWFNGNLHQLVIAGKQASASEITATESFINQKTGAY